MHVSWYWAEQRHPDGYLVMGIYGGIQELTRGKESTRNNCLKHLAQVSAVLKLFLYFNGDIFEIIRVIIFNSLIAVLILS